MKQILIGVMIWTLSAAGLLSRDVQLNPEQQKAGEELETLLAQAGMTKELIIGKAWKAMFGERQNADIHSIYVESYFHGSTEPNRISIKRPNFFRNDFSAGILVFDGQRAAWAKRAPDEAGNAQGPELIEPKSWRHFEVDIAIVFPAFFDYPSEFMGVEQEDGSRAYKLLVRLPLGSRVIYFIDSTTFRVIRRLVSWDGGSDADLWENRIDGYVEYSGVFFPDGYLFKGREGMEKGLYKNVRFNFNPPNEWFEIPKELLIEVNKQ